MAPILARRKRRGHPSVRAHYRFQRTVHRRCRFRTRAQLSRLKTKGSVKETTPSHHRSYRGCFRESIFFSDSWTRSGSAIKAGHWNKEKPSKLIEKDILTVGPERFRYAELGFQCSWSRKALRQSTFSSTSAFPLCSFSTQSFSEGSRTLLKCVFLGPSKNKQSTCPCRTFLEARDHKLIKLKVIFAECAAHSFQKRSSPVEPRGLADAGPSWTGNACPDSVNITTARGFSPDRWAREKVPGQVA